MAEEWEIKENQLEFFLERNLQFVHRCKKNRGPLSQLSEFDR